MILKTMPDMHTHVFALSGEVKEEFKGAEEEHLFEDICMAGCINAL